jgi:hypothetical protein
VVTHRDNRKLRFRTLAEPLERLAQANIALILVQALIIRLTVEMTRSSDGEPDPPVLIGFLVVCLGATALVLVLNRVIRRFPPRWLRLAAALGTILLQATAFQLLHTYAS